MHQTLESNVYVVMWDSHGVEAIVNANELDAQDVFNNLNGNTSNDLAEAIGLMCLKANRSEKHYEIYSVKTELDVSKEDLFEMFETDFVNITNLIRANGKKIYG